MTSCNVLILGASYGSLAAIKLQLSGHKVMLVARARTVSAINRHGTRVRLPVKGRPQPVELDSRVLPGELRAAEPAAVDPSDYDLVVLAMQEPHYAAPGVRALLGAIARAQVACVSLMNMPPLPYLKRIGVRCDDSLKSCYTDAGVWDNFQAGLLTACSPDPQVVRVPETDVNIVEVTLPTNFKVARFDNEADTAMLRRLQAEIEAARYDPGDGPLDLPVKLKVHDSIFVPLAKWAMLLTGNYRCMQNNTIVTIKDAVHSDIEASRSVYSWVSGVCERLGALPNDLVAFEHYANAAQSLIRPSSAARALVNGAIAIERTDRLVQTIGRQFGMRHPIIDQTVAEVDRRLAVNRKAAA